MAPAACTHTCQASLRDSRATTCSATPATTIPAGAAVIAVSNSCHLPAMTVAIAAVTATDTIAVSALRLLRHCARSARNRFMAQSGGGPGARRMLARTRASFSSRDLASRGLSVASGSKRAVSLSTLLRFWNLRS